MVICAGNCTMNENDLKSQLMTTDYFKVFNSKEKSVKLLLINEPKEINEIYPYFQQIQTVVTEPFDYLCFKLHYVCGKQFRKEFVEAAKRFGIKNICIVGERKALLLDAISLFPHTLQHNDVFWIITYKSADINCYIWKYDEKFGWQFKEHCCQVKSFFHKTLPEIFLKDDLQKLNANIEETETVPFLFVFASCNMSESCEAMFKNFFTYKDLVLCKSQRPNSCLNYARYLSGETEYAMYKSQKILESLIEVKMNDEPIIQVNQCFVLPLTKSHYGNAFGLKTFKLYENKKCISLIKRTIKGYFKLYLDVDESNICSLSISSDSDPPMYSSCSIPYVMKNIKCPIKACDNDGVQLTDGLLDFKVEKTNSTTVPSLYDANEVYRNFSTPKGLALIINNKKFARLPERKGTEIDELNIKKLLSQLGYVIETRHNLSAKEMLSLAHNFAKKQSHKLFDSCVVVVLTHGAYDVLLGSDEQPVNLHDFLRCFNSMNAPLLKGKPKLFFMQACRGGNYDFGADMTDFFWECWKSKSSDKETPPYMSSTSATMPQNRGGCSVMPIIPKQPNESDMLIAYATPPNYVSWRSMNNGSWFIQSICEIFSKHSKNEDICSLLTKVHRRVAEVYETSSSGYKQIPVYESRLQKKFYFFPGI